MKYPEDWGITLVILLAIGFLVKVGVDTYRLHQELEEQRQQLAELSERIGATGLYIPPNKYPGGAGQSYGIYVDDGWDCYIGVPGWCLMKAEDGSLQWTEAPDESEVGEIKATLSGQLIVYVPSELVDNLAEKLGRSVGWPDYKSYLDPELVKQVEEAWGRNEEVQFQVTPMWSKGWVELEPEQ